MDILKKIFKIIFPFSIFGFKRTLNNSLNYSQWITEVEHSLLQNKSIDNIESLPVVSIILIASPDLKNDLFNDSINSVGNQITPNWELLLFENCLNQIEPELKDKRIRILPITPESNFFELVNIAVKKANGDKVIFINQGDKLSKYAVGLLSQYTDSKLIVSDEDYLDESGQRCNPFFKPDWNPDYLLNYNYFSKGVAYDRELFIELNGFRVETVDPFYDLALRVTSRLNDKQIGHISSVLFHFKDKAKLEVKRVKYDVCQPTPLVTLIIPTKDQLEFLQPCLEGIFNNTKYNNIEIIVIDNQSTLDETSVYLNELVKNSRIRVLAYDKSFNFSEMNNIAVQKAKGSIFCFLNNDVSVINEDWLSEMVSYACRPEIGCVGAKLFYPDGTIQHAGVILGLRGYASHAFKGFSGDEKGYGNRLIATHNVSAVTAACLVVRKEVFEEVGGFDAVNLKVAYNDVDFCLKVKKAGYRNLFTPHAQLFHYESKTRGKKRKKEKQEQLRKESSYLLKKWGGVLFDDPAYNKNLTLLKEDFSLGFDRIDNDL